MRKVAALIFVAMLVAGCMDGTRPAVLVKPLVYSDDAGDFTFVVMGDNRPWTGGKDFAIQNTYFAENIRLANTSGGEFAVNVGDLIHGYAKDAAVVNRMWDDFDRAASYFQIPLIPVVGNHDVPDRVGEAVWRKRIGPTYFSWDYKGCHFIGLNSEVVGGLDKITGFQLAWLKEDLKRAAGARRIFVFVHKPLWRWGPKERVLENRWHKDVHPLLAAAGVDTVFGGHDHQYLRYPTRDGVNYVVTGGAGAELHGAELEGGFFHICIVTVKGSASSWEILTPKGRLPADFATTDLREQQELDLGVEPLESIPQDGFLDMKARLKNPVDRPVFVTATWDTKGTSWEPLGRQGTLACLEPRGEASFAIQAQVTRGLFPLPTLKVELLDETRKKLLTWNPLKQALAKVAPMVRDWNVAGPFDLGLPLGVGDAKERYLFGWLSGWDGMLPPEKRVDLAAVYRGKGGKQIAWETMEADTSGVIDLGWVYKTDYAVACAVTYVYSPKSCVCRFAAGSNDSLLVRVNGEAVWSKHAVRGVKVDQDTFPVWLNEGWNEVLLKIANFNGGWGFCLRVLDPSGSVKFALEPEAAPAAAEKP
jgi:hypothetical protein